MFSYIVVAVWLILVSGNAAPPGPTFPPTIGQIWPKPVHSFDISNEYVDNGKLLFDLEEMMSNQCSVVVNLINKAIDRYYEYQNILSNLSKKYGPDYEDANKIVITTDNKDALPCEYAPYFGMDESYNLTMTKDKPPYDVVIKFEVSSVWGFIRFMETLTQMLNLDEQYALNIQTANITDYPKYPHRGLLLDTSRHFLPVEDIQTTIDAMAMNKMNVLHWHMVDDQSFPYKSETYPELSEKGAYHSSLTYSKADLEKIRNYATERAVRIVLEIDIPGHVASWGASHPEIITDCLVSVYSKPLNPIKVETYEVVKGLLKEIREVLNDTYIHLGGDEVYQNCWEQNPLIKEYMEAYNMTVDDLMIMFFNVLRYSSDTFDANTTVILWEDAFDAGVRMSTNNTVYQAWRNDDGATIVPILQAGYKAIQSSYYYLDHLDLDFRKLYMREPRLAIKDKLNNDTLLQNLVGGEACMWGELVDSSNVISRVWGRASAVAEVLWSDTQGKAPDADTLSRMEEHVCRMLRRGLAVSPQTGPGYCVTM